MQPHLIIENFNGRVFCAVDFGEETHHDKKRNPRPKRILLKSDEAILSIDILKRLYAAEIAAFKDGDTIRDKLLAEATEKTAKLKKTLEGIIKTSHHDGEIQSAKAAWKRITGNEYA